MAMVVAKPADKPSPSVAAPEQAPATVASIAPKAADLPPPPAPAPSVPLVAAKSMMAPPDPAAAKLVEPEGPAKTVIASPIPEVVAAAPSAEKAEEDPAPAATASDGDRGCRRAEDRIRRRYRGRKFGSRPARVMARHPEIAVERGVVGVRPIIVIRESNSGLGMQLRLVAGPLSDAAAAAKICAGLIESKRPCETTVFEGQRLAMKADEKPVGEPRRARSSPWPRPRALSRTSMSVRGRRPMTRRPRSLIPARPVVVLRQAVSSDKISRKINILCSRFSSHSVTTRCCAERHSRSYLPDEKTSVSADALSGAVAAGGRLRDHRLCAVLALSRDRVLSGGAGLRCRACRPCCARPGS